MNAIQYFDWGSNNSDRLFMILRIKKFFKDSPYITKYRLTTPEEMLRRMNVFPYIEAEVGYGGEDIKKYYYKRLLSRPKREGEDLVIQIQGKYETDGVFREKESRMRFIVKSQYKEDGWGQRIFRGRAYLNGRRLKKTFYIDYSWEANLRDGIFISLICGVNNNYRRDPSYRYEGSEEDLTMNDFLGKELVLDIEKIVINDNQQREIETFSF